MKDRELHFVAIGGAGMSGLAAVSAQLAHRGWLARSGDVFAFGTAADAHVRVTVHHLDDRSLARLADDVTAAVALVHTSMSPGAPS